MPRAYSLDLRERVVGLVASGEPCRAVAELLAPEPTHTTAWDKAEEAEGRDSGEGVPPPPMAPGNTTTSRFASHGV